MVAKKCPPRPRPGYLSEDILDTSKHAQDICKADPLPLTSRDENALLGFSAPYVESICKSRMASGDSYGCAVNALWANPLSSITPGVPLLPGAIFELQSNMFFKGPCVTEHRLEICAPTAGTALSKGDAVRISPEEPQHALILAIADAITCEAPEDELTQWKRVPRGTGWLVVGDWATIRPVG